MVATKRKTTTKMKTKQQKVIALRAKYPDMTNKDIATKVGCNATYVSQILRLEPRRDVMPTNALRNQLIERHDSAKGAASVTAAKRRTGLVEPTSTQELLTAYHDMQCIVSRVGTCSAKTLLEDITNGTT